MDALKSAGRAIMRSPSLARQPRHHKLADTGVDSRDALLEGVTFHLKYLGMTLVEKPKGEDMAAAAIRRIISMTRARGKPLQKVIVTVTAHGITLQDAASTQQMEYVSIYRISYCTTDKVQNKVFAYVAQNESSGALECHGFLSPKKKLAQAVTLTVAQAFTVALDLWQSSREGSVSVGKPDPSSGYHEAAMPPSTGTSNFRTDDRVSAVMDGSCVTGKSAPHRDDEDDDEDDDLDEDFTRLAEVLAQQMGFSDAVT
ncbi:low density lipoprotein receptor adapter protein 1-B-like isoform X2 [Engystomops pustulosus]|uniref:low density lipoprotein receptor adapter protein 1-B-like isoform X2 n=1 Tax=Engystomops pustulosus TaxID=76066 RepID=UPI003AFABB21